MIDVTPVAIPLEKITRSAEAVSFDAIVEAWKSEENRPVRTKDGFAATLEKLGVQIGHRDAARVKDTDIQDYIDSLRKAGKSPTTVKIYIAHIRAIFGAAVRDRNIPITSNPCDGIRVVAKASKKRNDGFTLEETALLLHKSREASPLVRIMILLETYWGARPAEIFEAKTQDFEEHRNGHLVLWIREENRDEGQTIKTDESDRKLPVHRAIVDEIRAYLRSIPEGPLFPMVTKRGHTGKLSENAGSQVNKWIQKTLGNDKTLYYFRHAIRSALRDFGVAEDVADAIVGHKNASIGRKYGKFKISTLARAMESVPADPMLWEIE